MRITPETQAEADARALLWLLRENWQDKSTAFARACDELADAWPGQRIGEDGYSEGARIANHLRIVARTVRGVNKRVKEAG